ncbi:MAG TPA: carbohydrate porin [Steroidobacteraceae bacterium]|nr:carbohydrate porin [Steroidobacteraceae bacterium]
MKANNSTSAPARRAAVGAACAAWLLGAGNAARADEPGDAPELQFSAGYIGDLRRNTTGGLEVGTAYSHRLDLGLTWNTSAFGNPVTANLSVMHLGGDAVSGDLVGDLQGINNIEAPDGWRLYESWVEMSFGESTSTFRAGVLDLNAEFDTPVSQAVFVASPFGIGTELAQTGLRGPVVWPTTGLGMRASGAITDHLVWRAGAYDGAPGTEDDAFTSFELSSEEGALLIGEIEYSSERIHKASLGSWAYTAAFERIDAPLLADPVPEHGNQGFYASLDAGLGAVAGIDLDASIRAGTAPARFNVVDRYVGAAMTATHFWKARPGDTLGFGVAYAHVGTPWQAVNDSEGTPATSAETVCELVYRAELAPWIALVPSIQYVDSPGALQGVDDSWVFGMRFELAAEHGWHLAARQGRPGDDIYARRDAAAPRGNK